MKIWMEKHASLRMLMIAAFFISGMGCILSGAKLSGQLHGLIIMFAGLAFLLAALWLYNIPFTDPKNPKY